GGRPPGDGPLFGSGSATYVHQVGEQFVGGGDDPGVRLESALGDDQVRELAGQVHVGHLESARDQRPTISRSRLTDDGSARVGGGGESRLPDPAEPARVDEGGGGDDRDGVRHAVRELGGDGAVGADRHILKDAHGVPVGRDHFHVRGPAELDQGRVSTRQVDRDV